MIRSGEMVDNNNQNIDRPRGRTEGFPQPFGNGAITGHTEMTARHFVRDDKGDVIRPVKTIKIFGLTLFTINKRFREVVEDRRKVIDKCVTDAFVNYVVDQLQTETSTFGDFKYHDSGTGTGAEAAGDTGLGTPCGDARDTGTQVEGATANIYKSVATHTYGGSLAITEHGLFNASSNGTLMDRTKFAAINVVSTDQIEFTFQITFASGG
jgi:hypothetical protein